MRTQSVATCHPERPHYAKGLCRQCYQSTHPRRSRAVPDDHRILPRYVYPLTCTCGTVVESGAVRGMCRRCAAASIAAARCTQCGTKKPGTRAHGMCTTCYQAWYYETVTLPKRRAKKGFTDGKAD